MKRKQWVAPGRTDQWWQNLQAGVLLPTEWHKNLCMEIDVFMELVNSIRNRIGPHVESFRRDTIAAEKRVAMVLYYLKDQGSFRMTANTFGVSIATVSSSLRIVCKAINEELGPRLIKFPSTVDELKAASALFESKFGFPQAVGCADGTHIPIKQPIEILTTFSVIK